MPNNPKTRDITTPTARRLTEYLLILEELMERSVTVVSSKELAEAFGNTPSQVRQDLFRLSETGRVGQGYSTGTLARSIRETLGTHIAKNLVIVGCGMVGRAIAAHVPFDRYGLNLIGMFDINPNIIGETIENLPVSPIEDLGDFIERRDVLIASLSVPTLVAQEMTDKLVARGVRGVLNFTRARLKLPANVSVVNSQMICQFTRLGFMIDHFDTVGHKEKSE